MSGKGKEDINKGTGEVMHDDMGLLYIHENGLGIIGPGMGDNIGISRQIVDHDQARGNAENVRLQLHLQEFKVTSG